MAGSPRLIQTQQIHFLRKGFTFADDNSTLTVGHIPAGSLVLKPLSGVHVTTVFDGTAPQILDIGPSTNTDLWATDLSLSATTFVACDESVGTFLVSSDTEVQAVVDCSAAAAGAGEIIISYIPDIDG